MIKFVSSKDARIRVVSVFRDDEIDLHKYSAVLAAVEPFRLQMERDLKRSMNPVSYCYHKLQGSFVRPNSPIRGKNRDVDSALKRYESRISDILGSYGMKSSHFNILSQKISQEPFLKQRVLLQSYYYKIAADLESNTQSAMPILPPVSAHSPKKDCSSWFWRPFSSSSPTSSFLSSSTSSSLTPTYEYSSSNLNMEKVKDASQGSQLQRFARCLFDIERARLRQRRRLQDEIGVKKLPEEMSDPELLPTMSREIQVAQKQFQQNVGEIIKRNSLDLEDFESLNDKLKRDIFFRLRVQSQLKRMEKEDK